MDISSTLYVLGQVRVQKMLFSAIVVEGPIDRQDAPAHVVGVFPFAPM